MRGVNPLLKRSRRRGYCNYSPLKEAKGL